MRYLTIIIFCLFIISFYINKEFNSILIKHHNKNIRINPIQNVALNKKIIDQQQRFKDLSEKLNDITISLDTFKIEKFEQIEYENYKPFTKEIESSITEENGFISSVKLESSSESKNFDNNYSVPVPDGRSFEDKNESQKFDSQQLAESYFESAATNAIKFKNVLNPNGARTKVEYIDYKYQISQISLGLSYNPDFTQAYIIRSNAYFELGDYLNALNDINLVIDKSPKSELNFIIRGNIFFALKDYRKSLKDYKLALRLNPDDGSIYIGIGNAKYQMKLNYCREYKKACDKGYCEAFNKFCNK